MTAALMGHTGAAMLAFCQALQAAGWVWFECPPYLHEPSCDCHTCAADQSPLPGQGGHGPTAQPSDGGASRSGGLLML